MLGGSRRENNSPSGFTVPRPVAPRPALLRIMKNSGPCAAAANVSRFAGAAAGVRSDILDITTLSPGFSNLGVDHFDADSERLAFSGVRVAALPRPPYTLGGQQQPSSPRLESHGSLSAQLIHRCAQLDRRRVWPALPRPVTRW